LKAALPKDVTRLLEQIPEEQRPKGEEEVTFWKFLAYELARMMTLAAEVEKPKIMLNNCRQAGDQFIFEFFVNDTSRPIRDELNWHGQNTSQWIYAGCIKVEDGMVSTHH